MRAAVVGATGFIGSAVLAALEEAGVEVRAVTAPRLAGRDATPASAEAVLADPAVARHLAGALDRVDVVVNCAGNASAGSSASPQLTGANALLPGVLALAAARVGARRLVHVSSAAVQGRIPVLDESDRLAPFSPYSRSKAAGEQLLRELESQVAPLEVVRYRPTSVHGPTREVSRSLARLARSPLASVAGRGNRPTPQVLVDDVASAVRLLVCSGGPVRGVYLHPTSGLTTGRLLTLLGSGQPPRRVPEGPAAAFVRLTARAPVPAVVSAGRRLEMLWLGQDQDCRRLADLGHPVEFQLEEWARLARQLAVGAAAGPARGQQRRKRRRTVDR